jgi:hypothetical protein
VRRRAHRRPDEPQIVGEAHGAARDRERRDEQHLKDEQESHQRSDAERLVRFA